jgi:putative CocE/NonD family hydrolase
MSAVVRPRLLATSAVVLAVAFALLPQPSSGDVLASCGGTVTSSSRVSSPGPYAIGETEVVELASDVDGTVIQVGVIRPALPDGERAPVIVNAGPYVLSDLRDVDLTTCSPFLLENFVRHGYAVAIVPTRGAGGQDNCANLMGERERADLDQAVTWLGTQPWSTGDVGMIGLSYDGSTPWAVAAAGNPHLKTIVPASGVHNLFDLVFHRGRTDGRWWFFVPGYEHYYGFALNTPLQGRDADRFAGALASCDETQVGMAASVESYRTGEYDSYGYWAERNMDPDVLERYRGSVLLVQGMQDWNVDPSHQYPFVNALEERGVYVKHLLGQWAHSWPDGSVGRRSDWADMLLAWWDRWLKGDEDVDTGPRAEVQDSEGRWRAEPAWPLTDAVGRTLHLRADGTLGDAPSTETATALLGPGTRNRYVFLSGVGEHYNDLPVDHHCVTCATFTYDVGPGGLHLTGIPELDLTLVPRGSAGHVAAFAFRVDAAGDWHHIGWGASDLRFPQGEYEAQPVRAGEAIEMTLPLEPLEAVLHEGEQLVLLLDQGHADDFPGLPFLPVDLHYGAELGALRFDQTAPEAFFAPGEIGYGAG